MSLVVVCRRASDPVPPGSLGGYKCSVCNLEVVVSPGGRKAIAAGGKPFCNKCGFELAEKAERDGTLGGAIVTPLALEQLDRMIEEMRKIHQRN
jgi:hypothetical protein